MSFFSPKEYHRGSSGKKHQLVFPKTRTCFSENTYDFSKKHVRVFSSLVINLLQNGNSHRAYCKIKHPK